LSTGGKRKTIISAEERGLFGSLSRKVNADTPAKDYLHICLLNPRGKRQQTSVFQDNIQL